MCCFLRGLTHRKIMFCFLIYLVIGKVDRMGFTHTHTRREERWIKPPLTVPLASIINHCVHRNV